MKPFTMISVVFLAFVAIVQGVRFAQAWPVSINGYQVPQAFSAIACVAIGLLAVMLWRESRRS